MRIERIETQVVEFPWGPPEDGITRKWPTHRVVADNGTVGIGRGGNPDLITREFEALLVGEDPRRIGRLWQRMYDAAWRFRGPGRAAMTQPDRWAPVLREGIARALVPAIAWALWGYS